MRLLPTVWIALCTLALCGPGKAGQIKFSGVLPNGALYTRNVQSMQEARFRYVVRQHTDYSCGAAALATLLRYAYNMHVDERLVIQGLMGVSDPDEVAKRGFSLLDIKHYVQALGLRGRGYRVTVDRLHTLRVPSIVLMNVNGFSHFVVLKQVHQNTVELADPILGNRSLTLKAFLKEWPSQALFVVIGSGFDRDTVLLKTVRTPSARALFARRGPISDTELLDFGFTGADLF